MRVLFQLLLIGKAVAAGLSGSLAIISSVIDSLVDLVSGALMWWSGRAIKDRDAYKYPQGIIEIYTRVTMSYLKCPLSRAQSYPHLRSFNAVF